MTETVEADLISETLTALRVERIIIVDDEVDALEADANLTRVKVGIREARPAIAKLAADRTDLEFLSLHGELPDDDEELREAVDRNWDKLSEDEQKLLVDATAETENLFLKQIEGYLPDGFDFVPHAAGSWTPENYQPLFEDEKPTLVFFDKNLSNAKLGTDGGEKLLKELLSRKLPGVLCGLLTQEVPTLEEESRESSRLGSAATPAVPVLGKFRLETAQQFALGMQAFGLANDLHLVRNHVLDAARRAAEEAVETTGQLAYVTLLASARSAYGEGLYEGSGIGRMLFTAMRRNVESALMIDVPRESLERIRLVMDTKLHLGHPDPKEVGPVQDAFESADHLIATLSPTEVGDIYEFSSDNRPRTFYILLAQPCDLMVRSRGGRDNDDGYFVLARLKRKADAVQRSAGDEDTEYHHAPRTLAVGQIPDQDGEWEINLADRAFMPSQLLDACVLNPDGASTIPTTVTDDSIPTIAWIRLRKEVDKWGTNKVDQARKAARSFPGKALSPEQRQLVVDLVVKGDLGRQFVDGKVSIVTTVDPDDRGKDHRLVAGIRRVGRLSAPHAKALLLQFSHFHTRPDLPVALLKIVDPPEAVPEPAEETPVAT